MTAPGVGAPVSITFRTAVDEPGRFRSCTAVGAHFGLTPEGYNSGETAATGGISKAGDAMVRPALYEAAHAVLSRPTRLSTLKRWAMDVARRRGLKRAQLALAGKLGTVLHRMWVDGTECRRGKERQVAA
jgi:transposase